MSFRIKTHSDAPAPPAQAPSQPVQETKVALTTPELPTVPDHTKFRHNEIPIQRLMPEAVRKEYTSQLTTPAPESVIEKDIIVYDKFKETWVLVKESEAYKYK
jgi:hypothetical protein